MDSRITALLDDLDRGDIHWEQAFSEAKAIGLGAELMRERGTRADAKSKLGSGSRRERRDYMDVDSALGQVATPRWSTADQGRLAAIAWWWPNHIPSGKLGLLDGDPGLGKSVILCDLIASATTGRALPDGSTPSRTGGAILYAPEDGYGDTIIPRLKAAGADLSKVLVAHAADFGETIQLPRDLPILEEQIEFVDAVLLAFDPWEFYLEADIIKGREQRLALEPINQCIAERSVVLIGTRHLNQQSGQKALYRGRGDITGIGVSRYGFIVGKDPKSEDPDDHVMVPHKHNLAPRKRVRAVKYRVEEAFLTGDVTAPRIAWNGVSDVTPDQALGTEGSKPQTAREIMEQEILPRLQAEGPMPSDEGWAVLTGFGIKNSETISRARAKLGIRASKQRGRIGGDWYWHLPGQEIPEVSETPNPNSLDSLDSSKSSKSWGTQSDPTPILRQSDAAPAPGEASDTQAGGNPTVAGGTGETCECGLPRASNGRCISGHEFRPGVAS